jgi:hypothetical protein
VDEIEFKSILHFIAHKASEAEIASLLATIDLRISQESKNPFSVDFKTLADRALQGFAEKFQPINPNGMTRNLVASMIKGMEPSISDAHLKMLLDKWVPDEKSADASEREIPVQMLFTMIQQFVNFSTGNMPAAQEKDLRQSMPDWPERYWSQFSSRTKSLIRDHLQGKVSHDEFWKNMGYHLTGKRF